MKSFQIPTITLFLFLLFSTPLLAKNCEKGKLCFTREKVEGVIEFYVENPAEKDRLFTLSIDTINMKSSKELPYTGIIKANRKKKILTLSVAETGKRWNYNYRTNWWWRNQKTCKKEICIHKTHRTDSVTLSLENKSKQDRLITLYKVKAENFTTSTVFPYVAMVPAQGLKIVSRFIRKDPAKGRSLDYRYRWKTRKGRTCDKQLCIRVEHGTDYVDFFVENLTDFVRAISLYDITAENYTSPVSFPFYENVEGKSQKKFFRLKLKDPLKDRKTHYYYRSNPGLYKARHDNSYLYALPYEKGKSYRVGQGFNGDITHFGRSTYAIDFSMKEGTPVHAAREGVVVRMISSFNEGGFTEDFRKKGNYIHILHRDGTLADYHHLQLNGAVVKVGDQIKRGQLIGYSGNTGYTDGPHLHFVVHHVIENIKLYSVRFRFEAKEGIIENGPTKNKYYTAK